MRFSILTSCALLAVAAAYQPQQQAKISRSQTPMTTTATTMMRSAPQQQQKQTNHNNNNNNKIANAAATAMLSAVLAFSTVAPQPAFASPAAAQISLNSLPPNSVSIQIGDLPVVGSLISGTYTKVPDGSIKGTPSVVIKSPSDKVKAISSLATAGHLEFDVNGVLATHLDVDVAADEAGVAKVRVASKLIPPLPFKNLASSSPPSSSGAKSSGKESPWNVVTNMGNGESYYYNEKSGVTQFERPDKI